MGILGTAAEEIEFKYWNDAQQQEYHVELRYTMVADGTIGSVSDPQQLVLSIAPSPPSDAPPATSSASASVFLETADAAPLLLTCLVLYASLLGFAYLLAQLALLLLAVDGVRARTSRQRRACDHLASAERLSPQLTSRLSRYEQLAWSRGSGAPLAISLANLTPSLRAEVLGHLCHALTTAVPLFAGLERRLVGVLLAKTIHEVCPAGEWVCHRGSIATCMYVLLAGEVDVIVDETTMVSVAKLGRFAFLGERCLFGREKRQASICAHSAVELARLPAKAFETALMEEPRLRRAIELSKANREAEMAVQAGLRQLRAERAMLSTAPNTALSTAAEAADGKSSAPATPGGALHAEDHATSESPLGAHPSSSHLVPGALES